MLILIDVHHSWTAAFSFEKGLNHQNHFFSGSLYPVKKSLPVKFLIPPPHHWGEFPPPLGHSDGNFVSFSHLVPKLDWKRKSKKHIYRKNSLNLPYVAAS